MTNIYRRLEIPRNRAIELDMGCGKGGFLMELARRRPDRLIIGSDVMLGRLRKIDNRMKRDGLENVRLWRANNRELVEYQLPDNCVKRLHILCPDPWPKLRHRDRRLLNSDFLNRLVRVMENGGVIHISTDDKEYRRLITGNLKAVEHFYTAPGEAVADIADIETEFEKNWKAAGKTVKHFAVVVKKT